MKKITVSDILKYKKDGKKIAVLTAYGFQTARIIDNAGIPVVLVGDSVGMVEAGHETTLPVTMDEMIYHVRSVSRACKDAFVVADMPFMSYQPSVEEALKNAGRFLKEAGADGVKVEGGVRSAAVIKAMAEAGIPVMGHVGLTPQSVLTMGGYKVQGRTKEASKEILADAKAVEDAGAFSMVLEGIPSELAKTITKELSIPTIGIGAGVGCDGQVLVLNDMLGMDLEKTAPKFVKRYANLDEVISKAVTRYKDDVEAGKFPDEEHSY
ncbi:MAG: 3-methyl-2-oxobutanoate hydroxymethyltransferase [Deltaproteobacteria bacterium]|nr:3-methyl-2-oxobutanoate hydroxymethyltransferase [Deltaproteobacteria bacterium]